MRPYNFGAGPAALPESVLTQAAEHMLDWQSQGMSVMEISHRSAAGVALVEETVALFRGLLSVPQSHDIVLLGVPARYHYAAIPMNFLRNSVDYLISGFWSKLAEQEAQHFGKVTVAGDNSQSHHLAAPQDYTFDPTADYCFTVTNETLAGLRLMPLPEDRVTSVPLIADMTSCILSESIEVSDYGMIFAGAQKNFGPAGLSVVIIDRALLEQRSAGLPTYLDYGTHVAQHSMYATPPMFSIYVTNLTLKWLQEQGGVAAIETVNRRKAKMLYDFIDQSDFYQCPTAKEVRSLMNVTFHLAEDDHQEAFLQQAKENGLLALKGHRKVGGMRASLYNAMPIAGVEALVDFMAGFANE